jgi:hypothetical protein
MVPRAHVKLYLRPNRTWKARRFSEGVKPPTETRFYMARDAGTDASGSDASTPALATTDCYARTIANCEADDLCSPSFTASA